MSEVACSYAALILHGEGLPINGSNITKLLEAAKVQLDPYWPGLFARALNGRDIGDLLTCDGGRGALVPGVPVAAADVGKTGKLLEEREREEKKSSSGGAADLAGGIFGGDDGW